MLRALAYLFLFFLALTFGVLTLVFGVLRWLIGGRRPAVTFEDALRQARQRQRERAAQQQAGGGHQTNGPITVDAETTLHVPRQNGQRLSKLRFGNLSDDVEAVDVEVVETEPETTRS